MSVEWPMTVVTVGDRGCPFSQSGLSRTPTHLPPAPPPLPPHICALIASYNCRILSLICI